MCSKKKHRAEHSQRNSITIQSQYVCVYGSALHKYPYGYDCIRATTPPNPPPTTKCACSILFACIHAHHRYIDFIIITPYMHIKRDHIVSVQFFVVGWFVLHSSFLFLFWIQCVFRLLTLSFFLSLFCAEFSFSYRQPAPFLRATSMFFHFRSLLKCVRFSYEHRTKIKRL